MLGGAGKKNCFPLKMLEVLLWKTSLGQSDRRGQHDNTFFTENGTFFSVSLSEHVNVY